MLRSRVVVALLVLLVVGVTGCVSDNRPDDCDEPETRITVTIQATAMDPNDPSACRGQQVRLVVRSEVDGILHIHGLDAVVPATTISDGETIRLDFATDRSGQFPIELHPADDPQALTIGILTVYER